VVIALVLWPTSNWAVLAVAGGLLAILAVLAPPLAASPSASFYEEPQLESLDCRWHLDGGGHRLRGHQDQGLPRDLVDFELPPKKPSKRSSNPGTPFEALLKNRSMNAPPGARYAEGIFRVAC